MSLSPGFVPVRLGSRQRLMLGRKASQYLVGPTGELTHSMQVADTDHHALPVTAAFALSEMVTMVNSDWRGRTRSKELARCGTILAKAVSTYAAHPAFKGNGALGEHRDVVLPAWGLGHWRPKKAPEDALRLVLVPSVAKWKGSWFTTWEPKQPEWLETMPNLPRPDFSGLEAHA